MVVAYAMTDGSATPFTGSFPASPGVWSSATPVTPLAGTWTPWVLSSGSAVRLAAPPAATSSAYQAQVAAVKNFTRTTATNHCGRQLSFLTPWLDTVNAKSSEPSRHRCTRAARVYALEAVAHTMPLSLLGYEVRVSETRPPMADPTIIPVFALPQHQFSIGRASGWRPRS
jgi:hypothetical protein